jgi:protein-tyrosine-phosphatase
MKELGINMAGQRSKGLAEIPMQEIDLVVSFGDAHKKCTNLPGRAKIENWPAAEEFGSETGRTPELSVIRDKRDEIDKRVFALFLDHWRNIA